METFGEKQARKPKLAALCGAFFFLARFRLCVSLVRVLWELLLTGTVPRFHSIFLSSIALIAKELPSHQSLGNRTIEYINGIVHKNFSYKNLDLLVEIMDNPNRASATQFLFACHRCYSYEVVTDNAAGDIVCRDCGEVQADRIVNEAQEWRDFEDDGGGNEQARSSCTEDLVVGGSSTYFVGGPSREACAALAKCQILSMEKVDTRSAKLSELIGDLGSKLHLSHRVMVTFFPF